MKSQPSDHAERKRRPYTEEARAAKKAYYEANRERLLDQKRDYYLRKKKDIQAYRARNKQKIAAQNRHWHQKNRERVRERKRIEGRRRRQNPSVRVAGNLRRRLGKLIKSGGTRPGCEELLGCRFEEFVAHLASMFRSGMTWKNYGPKWHVDHIIPCSAFDLTNPEQVRQCFHFTNLRPMWARANLRKGATITEPQMRLLL